MLTVCPKCGHENGGSRCRRCGVPLRQPMTVLETLGAVYRVFRWVVLVVLVVVFVLILRPDTPPEVAQDAEAPARLENKVAALQQEVDRGRPVELRMDEAELNSWMRTNLQVASVPPASSTPAKRPDEPTIEEVQSNVRDVRIKMEGDRLRAYVLFQIRGKDMSLTLDGRLTVRDGYLRLEPSAMKLGSLPIPRATVDSAVRRLFDSPQNREQFRIPPHIRDIRVENGTLVVAY